MAAMGFFNHDGIMSGRSNDRAPYRVELRRSPMSRILTTRYPASHSQNSR